MNHWLLIMVLILGIVLGMSIEKSGLSKNNTYECGEYEIIKGTSF